MSTAYLDSLSERRKKLMAKLHDAPVLVSAGMAPSRNYPANTYEFRASSHFLYLAGLPLEGASLLLSAGRSTLFVPPTGPSDALWHGEVPSAAELKERTGVDAVYTTSELAAALDAVPGGRLRVSHLPVTTESSVQAKEASEALIDAMIELRLPHDAAGIAEMERAVAVTVEAHRAGMAVTRPGVAVAAVRAAMEQAILSANFTTAYPSIVTVHGEVLHSHDRSGFCQAGDLLLADVGSETDLGWASDVTRTWPVSGRFSPSQRAMYDLVLAANEAAIAAVRPGARYRDIHLLSCRVLCRGLVDEGLLIGDVDGLVEQGAHALFFPHGVGHLLGLDVHDMEDFGDRAGYAPGRTRSPQFGLAYLRLDRDLAPGMAVTIEPGIYFVPQIFASAELTAPFEKVFKRERLAHFGDVRGIRIEDDVLVTATGHRVLTSAIPKTAAAVEKAVGAGAAS